MANACATMPPYDQPSTTYGAASPRLSSSAASASALLPGHGSGASAARAGLPPTPARSDQQTRVVAARVSARAAKVSPLVLRPASRTTVGVPSPWHVIARAWASAGVLLGVWRRR